MRIVRNLGMAKRRLSFHTRRDQCRAGPGDVSRTAAQQSANRGLDRIRSIPPRTRSVPRFHAGSRYVERLKVVVTMVVTNVVTIVVSRRKKSPSIGRRALSSEKFRFENRRLRRSRGPCLRRRAGSLDHALIGTETVFRELEAIARLHRETKQERAGAGFAKVVVGFVEFDPRVVQFAKRALC